MNRRRFMSFLGLAPLVAAAPAVALPKPDKPTDIDKITVKLSVDAADIDKAIKELVSAQGTFRAVRNQDGTVVNVLS